jgi:hypothetical protein
MYKYLVQFVLVPYVQYVRYIRTQSANPCHSSYLYYEIVQILPKNIYKASFIVHKL